MSDNTNRKSQAERLPAEGPPPGFLDIVPNAARQGPDAIFHFQDYDLAIVEFDDLGCCYDRAQMKAVATRIGTASETDMIVVMFVHGWKHKADGDDKNLMSFCEVLTKTVDKEREESAKSGHQRRPILGIFVGWRGLSFCDRFGILDNLTFWDRQRAGYRVSTGSVRELFGLLRRYRNRRLDSGGSAVLVIVGHSFGGMIVYSALAQSLIEAASTPANEVVPRFADLVLLVNPAVEAARYLPVHALVEERMAENKITKQPPVFICATAKNDWATGMAFPAGNLKSLLTESYLDRKERQALINTIGHVDWMRTHKLSKGTAVDSAYSLDPMEESDTQNPFWVVEASPEIINGHNDIFKPSFLSFVARQIFRHAKHAREGRGKQSAK